MSSEVSVVSVGIHPNGRPAGLRADTYTRAEARLSGEKHPPMSWAELSFWEGMTMYVHKVRVLEACS